jgi:WD repeat and SOF domain-containing protein 1
MDRCVILYDIRAESAVHKVSMLNKSSCVSWNPIEPLNVVVANDDSNCYTYDIRKMELPTMIHKDHISAVMSVAFSASGREIVSGSFDRTIRIFPFNKGYSREVYHG